MLIMSLPPGLWLMSTSDIHRKFRAGHQKQHLGLAAVQITSSPFESWMTAAASPVTFSWRAPTPSGSWMTTSQTSTQKSGPWFSLTSRLTVKVGSLMTIPTTF
uniref:PML nuclear body scaffold n=1 Tax=Molossus molossus TaxID=27622 RepID=A0A7J8K0S4_MOLMO|nr:PML nuclear body scaffold [Molossus molossus]